MQGHTQNESSLSYNTLLKKRNWGPYGSLKKIFDVPILFADKTFLIFS